MNIKLINNRKRVFNLPCSIFDKYIKITNEASLKVILCMYASDEEYLTENDIIHSTGLDKSSVENAIAFWTKLGEISTDKVSEPKKVVSSVHPKVKLNEYVEENKNFKEYVAEAETSIGRIMTTYEKETLILLLDYYRFSPTAAILIFEHCAKLEFFSAKTVENVAASLFDRGLITYEQIEQDFERQKEYHCLESEIKRGLQLNAKLSKKQSEYLNKWVAIGFNAEMIILAGDQCINSTNKVQFAYMDKIIEGWATNKLYTPEAVEAYIAANKSEGKSKASKEHTYDLNEYDDFSLGEFIKK